jgi:arabinose-5-phosphate isomerase
MLEHTLKPMLHRCSIKSYFWDFRKKAGSYQQWNEKKVVGIITDGDIRRMLNDRDLLI